MAFINCQGCRDSNITVAILQQYGYLDAEHIHDTIINGGRLDCSKMKWYKERNLRLAINNNDISYLDPDERDRKKKEDEEFMAEFRKQPNNGMPLVVRLKQFEEDQKRKTMEK